MSNQCDLFTNLNMLLKLRLAQLSKALLPIIRSAACVPITALCVSTCEAGGRNADSAQVRSGYVQCAS